MSYGMRVIQIHDMAPDGHSLAFDLRDVLAALGLAFSELIGRFPAWTLMARALPRRALEPLLLRNWRGPARG